LKVAGPEGFGPDGIALTLSEVVMLTWRKLLEVLKQLDENQLDENVTVYDKGMDEYFPCEDYLFYEEFEILNNGALVLKIMN
jgi:hypothetical protein